MKEWKSEQAYLIFKYKFYTHLKGVHCHHGKLVDLQTQRHPDKNTYKDICKLKPKVKCIIPPVLKDLPTTKWLANTRQVLDMPKF